MNAADIYDMWKNKTKESHLHSNVEPLAKKMCPVQYLED